MSSFFRTAIIPLPTGARPILGPLSAPREPSAALLPPSTASLLCMWALSHCEGVMIFTWACRGTERKCQCTYEGQWVLLWFWKLKFHGRSQIFFYFNSGQYYQGWIKVIEFMFCHFVIFLRDPESQADDDSQEIFKLAKDVLIQGLIDENPGLQYVLLLE